MSTATRLNVDMSHWAPVTRLYSVDGGHLAVTVLNFLTARGTHIHYCDEAGVPVGDTMQAIADYPEGTTHDQALQALGYVVIDTIGQEPPVESAAVTQAAEQSVFDLLPPEIAAMIAGAKGSDRTTSTAATGARGGQQ